VSILNIPRQIPASLPTRFVRISTGLKWDIKKTEVEIPSSKIKTSTISHFTPFQKTADEIDDQDGFTVVRSKQKQKSKTPIVPSQVRRAPLDPTLTNGTPYHPDFAHIRSPSDVVFETGDGVLFWFSLSLISHHSPRFVLFDSETLWLRRQPLDFSSVIKISAVDSRIFAIIAHILLHDYEGVQKALKLEIQVVGDMPSAFLDPGVIGALRQAISFGKTLGIKSFTSMISSLIGTHAEGLLLIQTCSDDNTGWHMKQLLRL